MQTYNYTEHDSHFIVHAGQQSWLLDTGAPASVSATPLLVGETVLTVADNYLGIKIDELQEMAGTAFDALLGMDVLAQSGVFIDRANQTVTLNAAPAVSGNAVRCGQVMGVPTIHCNVGGNEQTLFVDTGAKITYVKENTITGYRAVGSIEDFYPGFGAFSSSTYRIPADLGRQQVLITVGVLPAALGSMLLGAGVDGILGNNAWAGRTLYYSAENSVLAFDAQL
jgi:hypothetical protein